MITIFYGDQIAPGSQPVLVFPLMLGQIQLAADLLSTYSGTVDTTTITGLTEGTATWNSTTESGTDEEHGTPAGATDSLSTLTAITSASGHGIIGFNQLQPITGQASNITATFSQDGAAFAACTGTLAEIGSTGLYSYVPATTETNNPSLASSSNTGLVYYRFRPTNARNASATNTWIYETDVYFRLKPPGLPTVNLNPGQADQLFGNGGLIQPAINQLENFIRQALRDLLGNQMITKPTFRRD